MLIGVCNSNENVQRNSGIIQHNSSKLKQLGKHSEIQRAQLSENNCTSAKIFREDFVVEHERFDG